MDELKKFTVEILNTDDQQEFEDAFKSRLNFGYTLGSSNAYFDKNGKQYFYAVFYFEVTG
jgi:hypothetical protein